MDQVTLYLDRMLEFEERGDGEAAIALGEKIQGAFPECRESILLETGKLKFRLGRERDALLDLLKAYGVSRDGEIYDLILEAYLSPNREGFLETYRHNMKLLETYPHYRSAYPEEAEPRFLPIWQDDDLLLCVDILEKSFAKETRREAGELPKADEIYLMLNEMWMGTILSCEKNCRISEPFMDMDIPMYLAYDLAYWILFLQLYDLKRLMDMGRIVFLIGTEAVEGYLEDTGRLPPDILHQGTSDAYIRTLNQAIEKREKECDLDQETIKRHYRGNGRKIIENIKSGKPRILFLTSRFTTALQYHARDCRRSAERLGCETELLMERDGLDRLTAYGFMRTLAHLKPDIVFRIDHFRFEEVGWIPEEAVSITWVQDPMPRIMDKSTPGKLTERDFVMNHYITWQKIREVGYGEKTLIDAPVPANHRIYKPYMLTEDERGMYACDICLVCHASDVESHIKEITATIPWEGRKKVEAVYRGYQDYVYQSGVPFYGEEMYREYIRGAMRQRFGLTLVDELLERLVCDMHLQFSQRIYRQAMVDWLIDAGYTNIKLWGNGWKDNPKYERYAMGPAENGETLSKIYQASKIVLGNNVGTTGAARAWEAMLSGAFYMSNYIPPEEDLVDIRKIMEVDEELVMFRDKEDLLRKVGYYLEHGEARQEMARRGREAALERMTYDILMERVLKEVAERMEGLEDGR